jgi:hypothetical protein
MSERACLDDGFLNYDHLWSFMIELTKVDRENKVYMMIK